MSMTPRHTQRVPRRAMRYAEPDPLGVVGYHGHCPHALTVWVPDPGRNEDHPSYQPLFLACTDEHAPRVDGRVVHSAAGRSWS